MSAAWLPVLLILLFVWQNQMFNVWIGLTPNPFILQFALTTFALGILFYGPSLLFGKRLRYLYLLIISCAVSMLFIAQFLYYSYSGGFLQASALKYASLVKDQGGTIATLITPGLAVFTLNVVVVLIAILFSWKRKGADIIPTKKGKLIASIVIGVIISIGYGYPLYQLGNLIGLPQKLREMNSFIYSPNEQVKKVGVANYSVGDIVGQLLRRTRVTPADIAFVEDVLTERPPTVVSDRSGVARGRNLILIQIESLETAVMHRSVGGEEITPHLNRLAEEGLYFTNYYTQIGPGNTADAEFTTLNSLYPLSNTVAFIEHAGHHYTALPGLLREAGYHTYVLHNDVPTFWNRANIYPSLGYETSFTRNDFMLPEGTPFDSLGDADFFAQSIVKMREFKEPFMTTLITLTSHTPFIVPRSFRTLPIPADGTFTENQTNYLHSIHYVDQAVGQFIDELRTNELYDDALIVIFGDHGTYTRISDALDFTPTNTFPELRNKLVPLIIIAPGTDIHGVSDIPGSHIDLYPTIAELLGSDPPRVILGQSLISTKTPIETYRDPYSRAIRAILTPKLAYQASEDAVFEKGSCFIMPEKKPVPVMECRSLYNHELSITNASDLIVNGDLIPSLTNVRLRNDLPMLEYKTKNEKGGLPDL